MTDDRTDAERDAAYVAARTPYRATSIPGSRTRRIAIENAGGILALVLLPICLASGISVWSWLIVFCVWAMNRIAHSLIMGMVDGLPQALAVGAAGFGMILRVWTIALVLFFVGANLDVGTTSIGLGRRDIAVPAMLLFMVVLGADLMVRMIAELHRYKAGAAEAAALEEVTP